MDILKKSLAPISEEAWSEINEEAKKMLKMAFTARKFVDVEGPKGWDYAAVSDGTIHIPQKEGKNKHYGVFNVQPLVEIRYPFTLNKFELDNITRGLEDVDFSSMEEAVKKIAYFEDNAIFNGFSETKLKGLSGNSDHEPLQYPSDAADIPSVIAEGIDRLKNAFVEGPYVLVLTPAKWKEINSIVKGYPMRKMLMDLLEGKIIENRSTENSFIAPLTAEDLKLTIGQDTAIGFENYDNENIELFFTETFAFQVNDPASFIEIK